MALHGTFALIPSGVSGVRPVYPLVEIPDGQALFDLVRDRVDPSLSVKFVYNRQPVTAETPFARYGVDVHVIGKDRVEFLRQLYESLVADGLVLTQEQLASTGGRRGARAASRKKKTTKRRASSKTPKALAAWVAHVKRVQAQRGVTYKAAMKLASKSWK